MENAHQFHLIINDAETKTDDPKEVIRLLTRQKELNPEKTVELRIRNLTTDITQETPFKGVTKDMLASFSGLVVVVFDGILFSWMHVSQTVKTMASAMGREIQ